MVRYAQIVHRVPDVQLHRVCHAVHPVCDDLLLPATVGLQALPVQNDLAKPLHQQPVAPRAVEILAYLLE